MPPVMKPYEPLVNEIYRATKNIKKGVLSTALVSAAVGGVVQAGGCATKLAATGGERIGHVPVRRIMVRDPNKVPG